MKLRIRSLESKQTLKIDLPSTSTLQNLKDAIADKISVSSETLHFSLNRKDEIIASPNDSLNSLGITSGDLLYFTLNPNGFSSESPIQVPDHPIQVTHLEKSIEKREISELSQKSSVSDEKTLTLVQEDETLDVNEGIDENPNDLVENSSSVPCFLQKVYKEEVGKGNTEGDHKLLIIAIHAVLLESGFVCFDSVTQKKISGFHLSEGWALKSSHVCLRYTIPDLLNSGDEVLETVDLKFQTLGKFVNVHGSLSRKPVDLYRLCLDKFRFVQSINFMCMLNFDSGSAPIEKDGSSKSFHESEVFELWKIAKDKLALPLLIDLCEKTGLGPPPCFMRLPTDLKLKTLEFLPGVDIAKVGCVSSELRYLSSNNDLWKQKYMEEFSLSDSGKISKEHWKDKFVVCLEKKRRKRRAQPQPFRRPYFPPIFRGGSEPRPFGFPGMIGGDHDRFPAPFGSSEVLRFPARRNFTPHCNLGGFDV